MTISTAFNLLYVALAGVGCGLLHRGTALALWTAAGHSTAVPDPLLSWLVALNVMAWAWIVVTKYNQRGES